MKRVTDTERACEFINFDNEQSRKELTHAKDKI